MRFPGFLLILSLLISPAMASEFEVAAGAEHFRWEEFDDSGRKMLSETGPRYFVGLKGINDLNQDWEVDFGGRFYSGSVDYDGETQSGIPVTTITDYNGVSFELGFTHTAAARTLSAGDAWLLRMAMGQDIWRRALRDTALADGTPVAGYVERYVSSYLKFGGAFQRPGVLMFGVGAKVPFYTREEIDLGYSTLVLNPEGRLSLFADMDIVLGPYWSIAIGYDSYRFAKSDPVRLGSYLYWQPESTQDTLSLALRYRF